MDYITIKQPCPALTGLLQYRQQFEHGRIYFHLENYGLSEFIRHLYILMRVYLPENWKCLKTHMKHAGSASIAAIFFS